MATSQAVPHDPMYNFDTHFPERLSKLNLHGEMHSPSGSFRRKKGRAMRSGARYKTQPVTFDEIKEVDEEPSPSATGTGADGGRTERGSSGDHQQLTGPGGLAAVHLVGQLQAFSRSMDGLVPKSHIIGESAHFSPHFSHSRSGSRKFQRHPDCIPERAEAEQQQQQQQQQKKGVLLEQGQQQLQQPAGTATFLEGVNNRLKQSPLAMSAPLAVAESLTPPRDDVTNPPTPSPNMAPRRQKITAKAKKRQKVVSESDP